MSEARVSVPPLAALRAAQVQLAALLVRTPLIRCESCASCELFLKLENLQPSGSFKVRPVGNTVLEGATARAAGAAYTLSSGNSALALAWLGQRLGIAVTAVVSDSAPQAKLARLRRLGARITAVPFADWWRAIEQRGYPDAAGEYIDAVRDPRALAGDATLGLEILEELPDLDAIFVPFGGGALACGIACAVHALGAQVPVVACELTSAQPLGAALAAGRIVATDSVSGFVSGVGFHALLPEMWPLARQLLHGSLTVTLAEVAAAIRTLALEQQIIAEGAGALPVAAAWAGRHRFRRVCAVVSGGNLGHEALCTILGGGIPG
jgi:threonine dehydratase